jgi:acetyl-CoA synthetase
MTARPSFLESRDFLLAKRADYEGARTGFVWPRVPDFNWALDYFDPMAVGNENLALWIVEESGEEHRMSFAALSARSNQVANWLRAQGVQRGDRLLLVLGNEVALWEVMLAAIKLGVVLIRPPASSREMICGTESPGARYDTSSRVLQMLRRSMPWAVLSRG